MRAFFYSFVLIATAAFASCADDEQGSAGSPADTVLQEVTGDFYKRFSGTLDGKAVVMHLHRMGNYVGGNYYYKASGTPIGLFSWNDTLTADATLELTAYNATAPPLEKSRYPRLWLVLRGNKATGKWTSADSMHTADVVLQEEYPSGSVRLTIAQLQDSTRMFATKAASVARATYGTVVAASNAAKELWLDGQIRKVFGEAASMSPSWAQALRAVANDYFADYRSAAIAIDSNDIAVLNSSMHRYNTEGRVLVMVNDGGWLVLENKRSDYTGGAHDNHGSSFLNLDVQDQRIWKLMDVVADTNGLSPFLASAAITRFGLAPDEALSTRLFVDNTPVTDNFYLTPTGLGFVYNPYEIASYADGEVHPFIPYKRLLLLLTDGFKQRMGLSSNTVMQG